MTTMAEYQAIPALSAGGAIVLANDVPARYWVSSPLNPRAIERTEKLEFDIGTACHLAVLEPHLLEQRVVVVPFDDWRKNEAKALRDHAYANGRTPLLPKHYNTVQRIKEAIQAHALAASLFRGGEAEVCATWGLHPTVPCKARADYLARLDTIVDLKTCESAHPNAIARKAFAEGWHQRAAWYLGGYPDRERYGFVCVEKEAPYLIAVYEMDERALEYGALLNRRAVDVFAQCQRDNHWPGYGDAVHPLALPSYAEFQYQERIAAGEFSAADLKLAAEFQRPF